MGERYPGIAKACFLIAIDNGGIHRDRSEKQWRREYDRWIERQDGPLTQIDVWLSSLPDERLDLVCTGGRDEPETVEAEQGMPPFTDDLLTRYFEEVC